MKASVAWVSYTVLRLLFFAVPLVVLLLLRVNFWISVVAAAVIGLCLSYLLLHGMRGRVATSIAVLRSRERPAPTADDDVEDAAVDRADRAQRAEPAERWRPSDDEDEER